MISTNLTYCRPDTIKEASLIYDDLKNDGKSVKFYSGGTEIITMMRASSLKCDSIIDLKNIPQMQKLELDKNKLSIGASVTLSRIKESNLFPLLRINCWKNSRSYKSK